MAEPLGAVGVEAAQGALRIVDAQMAELIRQLTVGRGLDPRDFVCSRSAAPAHCRRRCSPASSVSSTW